MVDHVLPEDNHEAERVAHQAKVYVLIDGELYRRCENGVKTCEACQYYAKNTHQPAQALQPIPISWPFAVWGLDIVGKIPKSVGVHEYLFVAIVSSQSGWK